MSNTQHTPGPWTQGASVRDVRAPALMTVRDNNNKVVAFCADTHHLSLITAAPDLLEALILLEREMVESGNAGSTDYGWKPAIEKTRAAIAKATGGAV